MANGFWPREEEEENDDETTIFLALSIRLQKHEHRGASMLAIRVAFGVSR